MTRLAGASTGPGGIEKIYILLKRYGLETYLRKYTVFGEKRKNDAKSGELKKNMAKRIKSFVTENTNRINVNGLLFLPSVLFPLKNCLNFFFVWWMFLPTEFSLISYD